MTIGVTYPFNLLKNVAAPLLFSHANDINKLPGSTIKYRYSTPVKIGFS